jgi:hypothetical protein
MSARRIRALRSALARRALSSWNSSISRYSMAQVYNGRIYLATEYVAPQPRDVMSDWATRIWDAPLP